MAPKKLEREVVQLAGRAREDGGTHLLPLDRHPELAEHPTEGARHEVLVEDAQLTALPAVTHLAKHRDDDLRDGVVHS